MRKPIQMTGFLPPAGRKLGRQRRITAVAALVTSIALALCTIVAATVVTAGIAPLVWSCRTVGACPTADKHARLALGPAVGSDTFSSKGIAGDAEA